MKKTCISFALILIIIALTAVFSNFQSNNDGASTEYLRIHIRANSNDATDQSVKYEIKDMVVTYLTPKIENVTSKSKAISILEQEKNNVNGLIDGFLAAKGFDYGAKTVIRNELFPTRIYEDLTLGAGYYDAVIIELGEAKGDNWWCVVYPPLCFTEDKVTYKSFIVEFIQKFFNK